ncbi:MAG TPA: preprotein translocase subunit YajC [Thermoanaerobaculia bacterium]|nr:preprotein translocase subunit YajC [Thermoanaerobaculia bacterium]
MNALIHLAVLPAFQGQPAGQSPWLGLVPMVAIFAIFYLLLVAPMRKKQRELAQTVAALKKGDKVITNGGLYGEIAGLDGNVVLLKVADNVRLRVAKSAIAGLEERKEEVST